MAVSVATAIRDRMVMMDVALARSYAETCAANSNSIKELLERVADAMEELVQENKKMREEK